MIARIGLLALAFAVTAEQAAAQWNNQPFQFRRGGGEVGMSQAYREAILQRRLGGLTNPLVRDAAGNLLAIERRGAQAFVRDLPGRYLPRHGGSLALGGLGFGLDGPGYPAALALDGQRRQSPLDAWTAELEALHGD